MTDVAMPRISIREVNKTFKDDAGNLRPALGSISLDVNAGNFTVLLGPSGCGKTTLLRCVAGLETPTSGEILVNGETVFSSEKRFSLASERRRLSMVFQSYALWPHMSILENVMYPLRTSKVGKAESKARAMEMLELVGLAERHGAFPSQLSGGQQQRVALARAIVSNSSVVLFDEPLSNLDAKVRERLRDEVVAMQRQIGFSALYVTHDQSEAMAMADTVVVMRDGAIEQVGTPMDVYERSASRYVTNFVGSVNEFQGRVKSIKADTYTVETVLGTMAGFHHGNENIQVGDSVIVGIRPDHISIDAPVGEQSVVAKIDRSMFLGGMVEYELSTASVPIRVRTMSTRIFQPGDDVTLSWSPLHVSIFLDDGKSALPTSAIGTSLS